MNQPPRVFKSAMLRRFGSVLYFLARRFYSKLNIPADVRNRLSDLPQDGEIVYVMRTRNVVDYLILNHVLKRYELPLAGFANGIDLTFFRSKIKWLSSLWHRTFSPLPDSNLSPVEQLETTLDNKKPVLIFMRTRTLSAERDTNPQFFLSLVKRQREQSRPIFLVPNYISLSRKPQSKKLSWLDIAFGNPESAGFFRKTAHILLTSKRSSLRIAEPINLLQVVGENETLSDDRLATKLRRVLRVHLAREAMAVTGPRVKPSFQLKQEILARKAFDQELDTLCHEHGLSKFESKLKARRYLKEIAAKQNFEVVEAFGKFLDFLFTKIYDGIELNSGGVERVRNAARHSRSAPLVLVPSHKSHVDYLVISWIFMRNEFISPHIVAGANLSFFPIGTLFRYSGAFFLRRTLKGLHLYKLVFRHYLWKLAREGYPIEFFIEGGRSRTGKLLAPKMGILSMLVEGWLRGEYQDLQFVPVNLSYEKVLETGSYQNELSGGQKESESVGGIVRASSVLRSRYGRVYVSFEEPVRLSEYIKRMGLDEEKQKPTNGKAITEKVAYKLLRSIQEATVIAPSTLVGTVLLTNQSKGITTARLRQTAGFLVALLRRRGVRLSASLNHRLTLDHEHLQAAQEEGVHAYASALGESIAGLLQDGVHLLRKQLTIVPGGAHDILVVPEKNRMELDNYRNALLSTIAPDCIIATALLCHHSPIKQSELSKLCQRLSYWLRHEFIYQTDQSYQENFTTSLSSLIADGVVEQIEDEIHISAPKTLNFYRSMLKHLIEGYWLTADALRGLQKGSIEKKTWIKLALQHGEKECLQGNIERPEAVSTVVITNALKLFNAENLIATKEMLQNRKRTHFLTLSAESSTEELALRRDEIGVYLRDMSDELTSGPDLTWTQELQRPPIGNSNSRASEPSL